MAGVSRSRFRAAVRDQARCDAAHVGRLDAPTPTPPTVDIPAAIRAFVWRRDHGRCAAPGCRAKRNLEIHHIRHREHGGTHDAENLILLCSLCRARHKEHYADYPVMPRRPRFSDGEPTSYAA
jgi:5-methylcytosine-specific restriction endonuclease McrA